MIVEAHNQFRQPVRLEATRVLIRDTFGNPILLVMTGDDRTTHVLQPTDPAFAEVLRKLGELAPQTLRVDGAHGLSGPHGGRGGGIIIG